MATEISKLPPSSRVLRTEIEESYIYAKENLVLFKKATRMGIGNEKVFFNNFVAGFENLYLSTFFDSSLQKEKFNNEPLIDQIRTWLTNGKRERALGEKLFTAYYSALFSRNILSIRS